MQGHGWWSYIAYDPSKGKAQINREVIRRIFAYARPHALAVGIVLITIVAISLIELIPPLLYPRSHRQCPAQPRCRAAQLVGIGDGWHSHIERRD